MQQENKLENSMTTKSPLLRVAVSRQREGQRDRIEYEIKIESSLGGPSALNQSQRNNLNYISYKINKRYSAFRMLWQELEALKVVNIGRLKKFAVGVAGHDNGGFTLGGPSGNVAGVRVSEAQSGRVASRSPEKESKYSPTNTGQRTSPSNSKPSRSIDNGFTSSLSPLSSTNTTLVYIVSEFPLPPWKCSLGIAMKESDLSYRY